MTNPTRSPTHTLSRWQLFWSLLASIIFVPLAFWGVSLDEVGRILQQADWRPIVLAVLLFVFTLVAKTARWQIFFPLRLKFWSLFAALMIGQVVNLLLPARLGEVARVYVLRRREPERVARIVGTVGGEKLVELIALFVLTVLVAPFVPLPDWLRDPSLRLSALVLGSILALALVFLQQSRLRQLATWLGAKVLRIGPTHMETQFDLTLEGFAPLRNRARSLQIMLWSLLIWWLAIATNYALFFALPLAPSWLMATVLLLVLQVGVAVPSTPGKIGVVQYLTRLTLGLFGVSSELALSYSLLMYLAVILPQVLLAGPFVWQEFLSLRRRVSASSIESVS